MSDITPSTALKLVAALRALVVVVTGAWPPLEHHKLITVARAAIALAEQEMEKDQ